MWGAPGTGRKDLAERLLGLSSRICAQPTLVVDVRKSQTLAQALNTIEIHGSQPIPRILYLKDLNLAAEEAQVLISRALELKWYRILIVAIRPSWHPLEKFFWFGPLDRDESWRLAESVLELKGIEPQAAHRRSADKLGGHFFTVLAGAEAMAALPPSELKSRCDSTEDLLNLSPRANELDEVTAEAIESLPIDLQPSARRMGFLGCPFRPGTREGLIEVMSQTPLTPILDASLAVWEHGWLKPLPQLVWHTRRHRSMWLKEEEESWVSFARWCLQFCDEASHSDLVTSEIRSHNREYLAKTWAKCTSWTQRAGFNQQERELLLLGAAARCLASSLLDKAEDLLKQLSKDPEGHEGTLEIFYGWLEGLKGNYEESINYLQKGIEKAMSAGRNYMAGAGLLRLGNDFFDLGKTVTAEFAYRQGADLALEHNQFLYPALLSKQSFAVSYQGRHEEALEIQLKAVKEWESFTDAPAAQAISRLGYARISFYSGKIDRAEADLLVTLPDLLEHELVHDAALACMLLALINVSKHKFSSGLSYGRQSEGFAERAGAGLVQTYALVQQTWSLMGLGRDAEADELIDRAASTILHAKHKVATAVILALLATQACRRGEHQLALMVFGAAEACWERSGRSPSKGEQKILDHFLKPSMDNVPPAQARSLKQAGSLIPPEQIVSQLMIDRARLLHPRVGQTSLSGLHQLSPREHEVFELLADAKTNREIAEILGVTEGTVKRQVHSLGVKLKMEGRFQLIQASKRMKPPADEGLQTERRLT